MFGQNVAFPSWTQDPRSSQLCFFVDSVIRETGTIIHDGLERIFVNAEVKDGTTVSELMECFLEKEVNNPKFPELTDRMYHLKHERGGLNAMCDVMEKYERQAAAKAAAKASNEEQILGKYSEEEYYLALKELE